MALYEKLLLSAGGGIVSGKQQAEQVENTATVIIGLGGTGIDCLRTIKTQVYSRLEPDNPEEIIPQYQHIRFLGVDASENNHGNVDKKGDERETKENSRLALNDTEFFSIGTANLQTTLENRNALTGLREISWLNWEKIKIPDLTKDGAGGIRQVGRFLMMNQSSAFMNRLEREIKAAKSGLQGESIRIHIISGLSGGTGSGIFLDVCYMVQSVIQRVGGDATILGYFFLPDVNLSRIPVDAEHVRAYIPRNGYAAMQELDYCMQIEENGGVFTQVYKGFEKITWRKAPVDICHLICATDADATEIPDAYNYAMNVTTEYIMDFLTNSDAEFSLSENLTNFKAQVAAANTRKIRGMNLNYCTIGASCASLPLREINTYLASELFDKFSSIKGRVPQKSDVERLAVKALGKSTNSFSEIYASLLREIREQAGDDYATYPDDYRTVKDYGNEELVKHYTNQKADKIGKIERNAKSMLDNQNSNSLINRIKKELEEIICDLDRGPGFAYGTLSAAQQNNLLNIIDGLLKENRSRAEQEAVQHRMEEYEKAKAEFERRPNRRNFPEYEFRTKELMKHHVDMESYEQLKNVLSEFRKQIEEVSTGYYLKLNRFMENLLDTFKANKSALESEGILEGTNSFVMPLMKISELKKSLDDEIKKVNIPGMMDAFMRLILRQEKEWIQNDENKITKLVRDFFVKTAFEGFADRSITSFLKDKYQTDNDEELTNKVYNEWMKTLTAKARPLFYFNDAVWAESNTSSIAYMSIPQESAPVKAAAQKMHESNSKWGIKSSALKDRIFIMSSSLALPISAYQKCAEFEKSFFSSQEAGVHYYEGKPIPGMIFDDWSRLPSLTPQSLIMLDNNIPYRLKEMVTEVQELYDRADRLHVFDSDNHICRPVSSELKKQIAMIEKCEQMTETLSKPGELPEAREFLDKVKYPGELLMERTKMFLPMDGHTETDEERKIILKDHFAYSPVYQIKVREIVDEIDALDVKRETAAKALEDKINEIVKGTENLDRYCDAVFTGVIQIERMQVVIYPRQKYDISKDDITLSMRSEEYPYSMIPLYQGYLSYMALDREVKDEIVERTNKLYNSNTSELSDNGAKLKTVLTAGRILAWARSSERQEQSKEIKEFLKTIQENFDTFCLTWGI